MSATLAGRTIVMSGGSRGIGLAIAEKAARDGANVALLAKTDEPHPKLEGTIHTAAAAIEAAGGNALPVVGDVRDEESVTAFIDRAVAEFGGIDVVVNNASAIDLSPSEELAMKRYDLSRRSTPVARSCSPVPRSATCAPRITVTSSPSRRRWTCGPSGSARTWGTRWRSTA